MTAGTAERTGLAAPAGHRLSRGVRVAAWASLISQIGIVGTGGAVRLTGSGLGCPTWPLCTADSLVNTPEMGIHGVIEFGNRLLTGVLVVIALLTFLAVRRLRERRPELVRLAFALGIGIIVQAVVGGVTVWLDLHPGAVGLHFMISVVLVALAAVLLYRVYFGPRGPRTAPRPLVIATHALTVVSAVAIYMGTLTTGAGPHAGDAASDRNGLDPAVLQHVHAWPGYAMVALTLVVGVLAARAALARTVRFAVALLAVELVQVAVGIAQSRLGLPEILVGAHMVLACVVVALLAMTVLSLRAPRVDADAHRPGADARATVAA